LIYAEPYSLQGKMDFSPIGINCHLCPREGCSQRAHQPLMSELTIDPNRRGGTRYDG
jgi:predicted transcriptional regulator